MPSLKFFERSFGSVLTRTKAMALVLGFAGLFSAGQAFAGITVAMNIATPQYPDTILQGDTTAFLIRLENDSYEYPVTNTSFTNTLPSTIQGIKSVRYECFDGFGKSQPAKGTVTVTGTRISLTGGELPLAQQAVAGGYCEIVAEVTSTATGPNDTNTFDNSIAAKSVTGLENGNAVTNADEAKQSLAVKLMPKPTLTKAFSKNSIVKTDEVVRLSITIKNSSTDRDLPLNGAGHTPAYALLDAFPAGLEIAPTPNAQIVCTNGVNPQLVSYDDPTKPLGPKQKGIRVVGGTVSKGGECVISVDVIGTSTFEEPKKSLENKINASDFHNTRDLKTNDTNATIDVRSGLVVNKRFETAIISAGATSKLFITLQNENPVNPLQGVTFQDSPIDGGSVLGNLTVKTVKAIQGCGAGAVFSKINNDRGISLTGGQIEKLSTCEIEVEFTGTLPASGEAKSYTNTIEKGAVKTSDTSIISNVTVASVVVVDQLTVEKKANTKEVAPGNPVQFTVTVKNYSTNALTNVRVTDALPSGFTYLSDDPFRPALGKDSACTGLSENQGTASAVSFTVNTMSGGTTAAASACHVTFWAMVPANIDTTKKHHNIIPIGGVTATGPQGEGIQNNKGSDFNDKDNPNTNTDAANIGIVSAIIPTKSFSPASAPEGAISVLTITISNTTWMPLTNTSLTDTFPAGLIIANPASASTTCSNGVVEAEPGKSVIKLTGATIPERISLGGGTYGKCTISVKVTGPAGNYINTIKKDDASGTQTQANNVQAPIKNLTSFDSSVEFLSVLKAYKSFSPTFTAPGAPSRVRLTLESVAKSGVLNNVSIVDPLPTGMTVADPAKASTTCGGPFQITATPGASTASIQGVELPAGKQCDFLFDVVGKGGNDWVNEIPGEKITADGGVKLQKPISATLKNQVSGSIAAVVNATPNSVSAPGATSQIKITITNNATSALNGISLADYFTKTGLADGEATGMVLAGNPNISSDCSGAVVAAAPGNAGVTMTGVTLQPKESCVITFDVTSVKAGTIPLAIAAGNITSEQGISNAQEVTTNLAVTGNVGISKQFTPTTIKLGERTKLRITIYNPVAREMTNLSVVDNLPAGLKVPASPNTVTTCTNADVVTTATQVKLSNGTMPAAVNGVASMCYIELDIVADASNTYKNTIAPKDMSSSNGDNLNGASATLEVRDPAVISKSFTPALVKPGVPSTVKVTITNPNTIALTKATLTDILPAHVFVAPVPNVKTSCAGGTVTAVPSATSATLSGATVPARGACTFEFNVISNIAGVYVNTIGTESLKTYEGISNDKPAEATLSLLDPPTVNKAFEPVSIPKNGVSKLTIVLGNINKSEMTLSSPLVDNLPVSPANITVATPLTIGGTCPTKAVATVGGNTVTYPQNAKIPVGGCTIEVNVTGSVEGTYNNYIPSDSLVTNAGSNVQPASANLDISPLGAISGKIFAENKLVPNGKYDSTIDKPLANQKVTLEGVSDSGKTVLLHAVTDALGNYAFTGLEPGNYTITQDAQPAGTANGITTAGPVTGPGQAGVATPQTQATSKIEHIKLEKDGNNKVASSADNNFAEIVLSSISGSVFLDQNNDGLRNSNDTGLAKIKIELLDDKGTKIAETETDDDGRYQFKDLPPGTYSVRQPVQPENTINGQTTAGKVGNGGQAGEPTKPDVAVSMIGKITLPPGTNTTENNFAKLPMGRQISGRVFADYDNNGKFDNDDIGLAGVELVLTGKDVNGKVITPQTITTDKDGRYSFIGLPEGTYTVTQPTQPPRTTNGITTPGSTGGKATTPEQTPSVISEISLVGFDKISNDNNFAERPILTGTVSGKVFNDTNGDGNYDPAKPGIGNVTMILKGNKENGDPFTATVKTDANGNYKFENVPVSDKNGYELIEVQPPSYKDGKTIVPSTNPGRAMSENVKTNDHDVIKGIVIEAGDVWKDYNFAETGTVDLTLTPPIVNGYVYVDRTHSRTRPRTPQELLDDAKDVAGWTVELKQNGTLICEVKTDDLGFYQFDNLNCPKYPSGLPTGPGFEISFSRDGTVRPIVPDASVGTPDGSTASIKNITLTKDDIIEQNLPLDPSGVIYDALTRQPINGAIVKLIGPPTFDPTKHLTSGSDVQIVGVNGMYEFWLMPGFPHGDYTLQVTAPPGYLNAESTYLPSCAGPLHVMANPAPGLVQEKVTAPDLSVPQPANLAACEGMVPGGSKTTQYYYSFYIDDKSAPIMHNHIPLDPVQQGAIMMTKTSPMVNVSRGDLVPYTVTATNTLAATLPAVNVRDQIPPGFKYRVGSASVNGVAIEPVVSGRLLTWPNQNFTAGEKKVYRLILTVGAGVGDGEYVNQAWSNSNVGNFILSNIATATVRVVPDPTFDCPDIIGKVFDDQNGNGYQDDGEPGIAGVRIVTARGLLVTTDAEGRFHVPCPAIPNADRGSNFVMKLDTRTLPSGYRVTTENPRDVRLTRGKVVKLNFGATIHRVVRLELSDAAFVAGKETLLPGWQKQLDQLPEQLKERPSVVRLGYTPGSDAPALVAKRKKAIHAAIKARWNALNGEYTLNIETEDAQ